MRASLNQLVLGAAALVSVTISGALGAYDVAGDLARARERTVVDAARTAALASPMALGALVVNDLAMAEQSLRAVNLDGGNSRVALLEPDGESVMLEASPAAPRESAAPPWFRRLLAVEAAELRFPIVAGGVSYGFLVLQPAVQPAEDEAWARTREAAVVTGLLLVAMTSAVGLVLSWGLRPLQQLAWTSASFGAGDYSARMQPSPILELDRVGRAFNEMARKLDRDAALQRMSEVRLEEAKRLAELASRTKSEFLANMSHELRTPLNSIIGFAGMLREEMFGPLGCQHYRDYVGSVHEAGEHLLDIVNDMLDVSAIEAGRLTLREAEVDLDHVAGLALRLMAPRAAQAAVALRADLRAGLPAVWADERRLKQVLLNLLSNAVKFSPKHAEVRLSAGFDAAGDLEIAVRDRGIGMDRAGMAMALERFGQIDSGLARKQVGTGLGLPLSRGLIQLHGGALRLESALGVGTTAIVTLPRARLRPAASPPRLATGTMAQSLLQ